MISDPRDYKIEINGVRPAKAQAAVVRPYLSVLFNCCRVYQRVYKQKDADSYNARCPKCGRTIQFLVGDGGTSDRSFVVE
ncbi:MAG TPA: hypothetical protein VF624_12495 [Tepidisphaeraceae bacterium]|jgi:hypothetical protein